MAAFPVPGFPVAALSMPGLPVAGISVAALQLAMSRKLARRLREALASAAGTHSIEKAAIAILARVSGSYSGSNYGDVAADMATMALLLLALLLVTPTVDPTVKRLRLQNGQSCYRTVRYQTRSGWRKRVVYVCD